MNLMRFIVVVCVLIVHTVVIFGSPIEYDAGIRCSTAYNFDYAMLAIQWAPSYCDSRSCNSFNRDSWGVHGMWPQYNNGSWPQYCCFESEFDLSKISNLTSRLISNWPTLNAGGAHESFWSHEWTKHGTCSMESLSLRGHYNYFYQSLNIFELYPLKTWLDSDNITPSSSIGYRKTAIHAAVTKGLGYKVELECLPKSPYPLLQHIYICLNKSTLRPIDCPRADDTQCGATTGSLLLPSIR